MNVFFIHVKKNVNQRKMPGLSEIPAIWNVSCVSTCESSYRSAVRSPLEAVSKIFDIYKHSIIPK